MNNYCIPIGILGARDKRMNKVPTLMELIFYLELMFMEREQGRMIKSDSEE